MRYVRKFHGPCPDHAKFAKTCGHCKSWRWSIKLDRGQALPHGVPIYRELHWPAPPL